MRGYDTQEYDRRVDKYDDYEYEDEGYGHEEEGDEYEEEEEAAPKPTKEALEYLELRQRLKEQLRREMKKEGGSRDNYNDRKKLPYDNFGSFFGPSQPVIAPRVIQESKSLLETQHLTPRVSNYIHPSKKSNGSTSSGSKSVTYNQKPKVINERQNKVQKLKVTRDYSFLLSEDAELPAPANDHPPQSAYAPKSEVRSSLAVANGKQSLASNGRPVHGGRDLGRPVQGGRDSGRPVLGSRDSGRPVQGSRENGRPVQGSRENGRPVQGSRENGRPAQGGRENGRPVLAGRENGRPAQADRDERKVVPTNGHMQSRSVSNRPSSASRPGSASMDSRKQLGSNIANGPGRPLGQKGFLSKIPGSTSERRASAPGSTSSVSGMHRAPSTKLPSSVPKKQLQQRKEVQEAYKSSGISKHQQIHKPQMQKQMPSRSMAQEYRPKKRPASGFADDEYDPESGGDISSLIRNMFGYNPRKFTDDDDDLSDMEAGFEDIQREERRSAKIAREEDEEQARLIEEEERRERMAAKMRKQKKLKR